MFENKTINYVFENSIDRPLVTLYSKKSFPAAKVISVLAVAILSLASLGTYIVYSYFYYQHRRVISLHHKLEKAVKNRDLQTAKNLLETFPHLKTNINVHFLRFNLEKSSLSSLLPQAVINNDLDMVKLLLKYGASPDNKSSLFVSTALTEAMEKDQLEIVRSLAERSSLNPDIYEIYLLAILLGHNPNRQEIAKCLLEKGLKLSLDEPTKIKGPPLAHFLFGQELDNFLRFYPSNPNTKIKDYLQIFYPHILIFINQHMKP